MASNAQISVLRQHRLLRSGAEILAFENALADIARSPNPDDLPDLLLVFTDATQQQEVMWGLLHFVESFGMERSLQALIQVLPTMVIDAPEWAEIFHCRILNDDGYRKYYKSLVASRHGLIRKAVEQVLNRIKSADSDFADRVDYVLFA